MSPIKCYCNVVAAKKMSKDDEEYYTCDEREWDSATKTSSGGCDFFFFKDDLKEDMVCECGDLWIPVRQKKYAFCRNHKCKSHKLDRINKRQPIWEEYSLGEEFQDTEDTKKSKNSKDFKKSNKKFKK